jgi:hypothetical protein
MINLFAFLMDQGWSKHNKNILLSPLIFNQKQINNYISNNYILSNWIFRKHLIIHIPNITSILIELLSFLF